MIVPQKAANVFRIVAPTLGTALGGPLGLAIATVASKVLDQWVEQVAPDQPVTPERLVEMVERNADNPQLMLDLKRAELAVKDYELRMQRLDSKFNLLRLEQQDRADARAFVRDTGGAGFAQKLGLASLVWDAVVTAGVLIGAFVLMTGLVRIGDPNIFAAMMSFVGLVLGRISTRADTYWNFVFGSSQGSKDKTQQLSGAVHDLGQALANAETAPLPPPPPPPPVVVVPQPAPPGSDAPPVVSDSEWQQGPFGGQRWRLTDEGVVVEGQSKPLRTVGVPATVRRIWGEYGPLIAASCAANAVPLEIVVACIATESAGKPRAMLVEPDKRVSVGLMQTLTGTASEVMGRSVTAMDLNDPALSIEAGVRYIASQRPKTRYQPPLVAAAYNAGGLYKAREQDDNPWNLRSTGDHITRFCQFFGDAVAVAVEEGWSHKAAMGQASQ